VKLCITGGGTGGHLMIAEALAEAAKKNRHDIIFIGSQTGQDQKYFAKNSKFSDVYFLDTTGVVNQKGLKKIKALYKVFKAFLISRSLLKKHKIEATYSVGGFSAAPASFATISNFIPLFIHEQNAVTGRLNSLLRPFAKSFISAYENDSKIKGYPVKEVFHNTARIRKELNTIIFLGGSHGAKAINDLALNVAKELKSRGIKIIHQAGENDFERVKKAYNDLDIEVELYSFTKKLPSLIARADLAISRAGASTLWEMSANGLVALFIPYPYAAGDHQYFNAKFIVENNMGWCQREGNELREKFLNILDEDLENRSEKLLTYTQKNVGLKMIEELQKVVK
jgi:UDP-N-acetylglucosamine--N-acetylmuramyl-(pentapeptide) pyrophosphoryl-undecaprenol N-acetylglucosamine transferase